MPTRKWLGVRSPGPFRPGCDTALQSDLCRLGLPAGAAGDCRRKENSRIIGPTNLPLFDQKEKDSFSVPNGRFWPISACGGSRFSPYL